MEVGAIVSFINPKVLNKAKSSQPRTFGGSVSYLIARKEFNMEEYLYLRSLGMSIHQISRAWLWEEDELIAVLKIKLKQ